MYSSVFSYRKDFYIYSNLLFAIDISIYILIQRLKKSFGIYYEFFKWSRNEIIKKKSHCARLREYDDTLLKRRKTSAQER